MRKMCSCRDVTMLALMGVFKANEVFPEGVDEGANLAVLAWGAVKYSWSLTVKPLIQAAPK